MDDLHKVVADMNDCFVRKVKRADLGPHVIMCGLFRKGVNLFHSIEILLRHGYAYEAAILCRTLLETLTHFRYIVKVDNEVDQRAREYLAFVLTRGAGIIKKVEENPKLHDFLPENAREAIKKHAVNVPETFGVSQDKLKRLFGPENFEKEMDAADLSIHYDVSYKHLSEYVHAQDVFSHVTIKEKEIICPPRAPDYIFELILNVAIGSFINLMANVDQFLKCGYAELIDKYDKLWGKLAKLNQKATSGRDSATLPGLIGFGE